MTALKIFKEAKGWKCLASYSWDAVAGRHRLKLAVSINMFGLRRSPTCALRQCLLLVELPVFWTESFQQIKWKHSSYEANLPLLFTEKWIFILSWMFYVITMLKLYDSDSLCSKSSYFHWLFKRCFMFLEKNIYMYLVIWSVCICTCIITKIQNTWILSTKPDLK